MRNVCLLLSQFYIKMRLKGLYTFIKNYQEILYMYSIIWKKLFFKWLNY